MNLTIPFLPVELASLFSNPWFYFLMAASLYRGYIDGKKEAFKEAETQVKKTNDAIKKYQVELRKSPEQKLKEVEELERKFKELKEGTVDWAEVKRRLRK